LKKRCKPVESVKTPRSLVLFVSSRGQNQIFGFALSDQDMAKLDALGGDAGMTGRQMFTSRLRGRPLLDNEGPTIGRIRDVVILPSGGNDPPRALGLIATLQRRRIFVNLGQITEISVDGAHLLPGADELDRFTRRAGEMLASELYGRRTEDGTIVDVAVSASKYQRPGDEELADLLEEMPEQDQVRLLAGVGLQPTGTSQRYVLTHFHPGQARSGFPQVSIRRLRVRKLGPWR